MGVYFLGGGVIRDVCGGAAARNAGWLVVVSGIRIAYSGEWEMKLARAIMGMIKDSEGVLRGVRGATAARKGGCPVVVSKYLTACMRDGKQTGLCHTGCIYSR